MNLATEPRTTVYIRLLMFPLDLLKINLEELHFCVSFPFVYFCITKPNFIF